MTREERIARYQETIERIWEDIEWIRETGFSFGGRDVQPGQGTADLIAKQEENIMMYEGFIAKLSEGAANA